MKIEDLFISSTFKTKIKFIPEFIDCLQIIKSAKTINDKKTIGWLWRFNNEKDKLYFQCFIPEDFWYKNQWCSMKEIFKQLKNKEIEISYKKNEKVASFELEKYIKEIKSSDGMFVPKIEIKKQEEKSIK